MTETAYCDLDGVVPNSPISCLYPLTFLKVALSGRDDAKDPPVPLFLEGSVAD